YVDIGGYMIPDVVYGQEVTDQTQGLPTVSKVRVLNDQNDWITTVTGYDYKARPIYGASLNTYLGTQVTSESLLDFTGKVLESRTTHQKTGHQEVVTKDFFSYDHQNRLITQMQQIDNEPVQLIASNTYDELGQLASKRVGGQLFESGYTDITTGRIDISEEGVITKTYATSNYDSGLATVGKIEGDGGLSFINITENKRYVVGFNDNNQYTNSTGEIDYAFFFAWNDPGRYRVRIRENDVSSYITGYINYNANDHFAIEREGNVLSFIQNGTVVATHTMTQNFPSLVGDMVMADNGAQISNLNLYATNIDKSLQKVDYQYNIRGWLTDINDVDSNARTPALFNFHINYDDTVEGDVGQVGVVPLYNGNISQTIWKTTNTDSQKRTYGYKYDALNRINTAYSRKGVNLTDYDHFNVSGVGYDKNGNIQTLTRQGDYNGNALNMDDLTYTYNANQLLEVSDNGHINLKNEGFFDGNTTGDDYIYDVNGNMVEDKNKGITTIEYNHLNLPTSVEINTTDAQGDLQDGTITYIYDATGIKLAKVLQDDIQNSTITTSYAGGYIYENNNGTETLKMFPHPEGYIEPVYGTEKSIEKFNKETGTSSFSGYQYAFNYTDHLGNVRLTYSDSDGDGAIEPTTEIISEKNYYVFGLQQKGYNDVVTSNSNSTADKFKYQGQELEEELGKNTYAYQWRDYDPAIGRFNKIDRFANKYDDLTPYHFSANNPIYYKEVKGDSINVAQQYQQQFNAVLQGVFGDNANLFSFNNNNNLVFNGTKKDLTKKQRKLFKDGFSDLLTEGTTTNVIFEQVYTATEGNNSQIIDTNQHGGEGTLPAEESSNLFSQNYVVINPNLGANLQVYEVNESYYLSKDGIAAPPPFGTIVNRQINPSLATFHGFGHIVHANQTQEKVLEFENTALKAFNESSGTNINKRNPDENHNKKIN
ncbi:RHS repeat-associated core domain-containing protein, partial [Dokdonia sp.]|uniref:RHS repeat domain-containing protein n=2 Tax=Dokdonia sp. TaxID=2024995 RepID=UPI0032648D78